uniref:Transmembrane protein n=1 Tax=Nelumbo nucifera TaxID=4432 RepID=A0A822YHN6_NELNU|nr:TPA_asm: hypothetical protein HUJ06_010813 [Nelumbo nucifera]
MKLFISKIVFFLLVFTSLAAISAGSPIFQRWRSRTFQKLILGEENLGPWATGLLQFAQAPGPAYRAPPDTLVLAAKRTNRPDILRGFKRYRGGWDISNKHYWASVGFTGAAGFLLAALWFVSFGFGLVVHYCCKCRISITDKGTRNSHRICFILLLVFTCAAAVGCILLSVGQDKFHDEALHTLHYVLNQSDYTVQTLRNVTAFLSLAKTINVNEVILPSDVKDEIDKLNWDLNAAANTLTEKSAESSGKIRKVFNAVRSTLIAVAAVMLLLSVIGLLLSVLGHQHAILIFILSGWLLVAITFILCGIFVILNQ